MKTGATGTKEHLRGIDELMENWHDLLGESSVGSDPMPGVANSFSIRVRTL